MTKVRRESITVNRAARARARASGFAARRQSGSRPRL